MPRVDWLVSSIVVLLLIGGGAYFIIRPTPTPTSVPPLTLPKKSATITATNTSSTTNTQVVAQAPVQIPTQGQSTTSPTTLAIKSSTPKSNTSPLLTPLIPSDWGRLTSALGFSLRYPYKEIGAMWGDDEYFQVSFFFPPSLVTADASILEDLSNDIDNIRLYGGLGILVIKAVTTESSFDSWINAYLKEEDHQNRTGEVLLSESEVRTNFAGLSARQFLRLMQGDDSSKGAHYTRKEIFVRDASYVYRISHLAPSADTLFLRSGVSGKAYLSQIDTISEKVLKTFTFDGSKISSITVPKTPPKKLEGIALIRRQKLLSALRTEPYHDVHVLYPADPAQESCLSGTTQNSENGAGQTLAPAPGIYIGADDEVADFHGYNANGRHTGPMPMIPGLGYRAQIEEQAIGIGSTNLGSAGLGLYIDEFTDGRIELVGKKFSQIQLEMNGDGNDCAIVRMLIYVTPYSVATIPMTVQGDLGPVFVDIDGDGVKDFEMSLVHPLLPQKEKELEAVIADMQLTEN